MSFYRIYRPQVLDELDNESAKKHLAMLLHKKKETLPHAYLLCGPKGTGKTTAARIIAKIFNCTNPSDGGPCGSCQQCASIANGSNLDVVEIDAASNRGIDEIRLLRDRIGFLPTQASHTVYIIDEVHMMTNEAFNALLKTLEEPPAHAVFVLATTDPEKVPDTIRSRCTILGFVAASHTELLHALNRIVHAEKLKITPEALDAIITFSHGSFRDAVKNLEQVSLVTSDISLEIIQTTFSLRQTEEMDVFLSSFYSKDIHSLLSFTQKLANEGSDVRSFLQSLIGTLQQKLVGGILKDTSAPSDNKIITVGIRILSQAYAEIRNSPFPIIPLEIALIEYCQDQSKPSGQTGLKNEKLAPQTEITSKKSESSTSGAPAESPPVQIKKDVIHESTSVSPVGTGLITVEKLTECWKDVIEELKQHNHSISGILRSARPKSVANGVVTLEAFYTFHKDKLSEPKAREIMSLVFKKLFGEKVKVEVVVGKK